MRHAWVPGLFLAGCGLSTTATNHETGATGESEAARAIAKIDWRGTDTGEASDPSGSDAWLDATGAGDSRAADDMRIVDAERKVTPDADAGTSSDDAAVVSLRCGVERRPWCRATLQTGPATIDHTDQFEGANIVSGSDSTLPAALARLFSPGTTRFADRTETAAAVRRVDFSSRRAIDFDRLVIHLDEGAAQRGSSGIRLYGRQHPGEFSAADQIAEVRLELPYFQHYGKRRVTVSIEHFAANNLKYFRLEMDSRWDAGCRCYRGPRVLELDAENSMSQGGMTQLLWSPTAHPYWKARVDNLMQQQRIRTVHFYLPWSLLEPSPGDFQPGHDILAYIFAKAAQYDKRVSFGVLHGGSNQRFAASTPSWMMRDAGLVFHWRHAVIDPHWLDSPVQTTLAYRAMLERVVTKVLGHYDGHPRLEYVQVSGPNPWSGIETVFPVQMISEADYAKIGLTHQLFRVVWIDMLDRFNAIFRNTPLCLGTHNGLAAIGWWTPTACPSGIAFFPARATRISTGKRSKRSVTTSSRRSGNKAKCRTSSSLVSARTMTFISPLPTSRRAITSAWYSTASTMFASSMKAQVSSRVIARGVALTTSGMHWMSASTTTRVSSRSKTRTIAPWSANTLMVWPTQVTSSRFDRPTRSSAAVTECMRSPNVRPRSWPSRTTRQATVCPNLPRTVQRT